MNEVETFIKKFKFSHIKELEHIFMNGNCYYFAIILKERFNGEIYYLPIQNHFICKIENEYYDIMGKAKMDEHPYQWSKYPDPKEKKRIIRDCVHFITRTAI